MKSPEEAHGPVKRMKTSLMGKLIAQLLLMTVIPIALVGYLSYSTARSALVDSEFGKRAKDRTIKTFELLNELEERVRIVQVLERSNRVKKAIALLSSYHARGDSTPGGPFGTGTEEYRGIYGEIDPELREYVEIYELSDLLLICAAHGHVLYSTGKGKDLGTNLETGPYKDSGLAGLWRRVLKSRRTSLVDFSRYEPDRAPAAFIGGPVLDESGTLVAVVATCFDTQRINELMREGMLDETAEAFIVGEDRLMRSDARLVPESTILHKRLDTEAVSNALQGTSGVEFLKDYRGVPALISYAPVGLKAELGTDFDWVLISKMDEAEAFGDLRNLASSVTLITLAVAAVVAAAGYFTARGIARPIRTMSREVAVVGEGDLTVEVSTNGRKDEIGLLSLVFAGVVRSLRGQTRQIQEASGVLASSSGEISTTVAQLAASISETSSSVGETTTTMEELKHTAQLALEKAKEVTAGARQTEETSRAGIQASEDTLEGMERIRDQMGAIAESITRLSEQSQTIGEIISSVNDLAGQSNLLAVNAAIEAAKAGEQGKGFVVVAEEIRRLAEQSKQATSQVQSILQNIQQGVSTAVLSAEQGTRAVEVGMQQAREMGEAIRLLGGTIEQTTQAMSQIAASSQQQMVGVEQVTDAIGSIRQSSEQNNQGAGQLEEAARNLKDLGEQLQELVSHFKV